MRDDRGLGCLVVQCLGPWEAGVYVRLLGEDLGCGGRFERDVRCFFCVVLSCHGSAGLEGRGLHCARTRRPVVSLVLVGRDLPVLPSVCNVCAGFVDCGGCPERGLWR